MATEPLRGADGLCAARSGALEGILLIPGRPRSRLRDEHGRLLRSGQVYLDYVRHLARRRWGQGVAYPTGQLPIRIELFYAVADAEAEAMRGAHVTWHLQNIPRADTAPTVILTGLAGRLYTHAGQVEPLTVVRQVVSERECQARFGRSCRTGAAVVRYG